MKSIFLVLTLMLLSLNVSAQDDAAVEDTSTEESAEMTEESTESTTEEEEPMAEESSADEPTSFEAVAGSIELSYNCSLNNDERTISLVVAPGGSSGASYTKFGEERTVAIAGSGSDHARNVVERIKSNLEAASFTCAEASSAGSAASSDEATSEEPAAEEATEEVEETEASE